jgi:hypothetical protein
MAQMLLRKKDVAANTVEFGQLLQPLATAEKQATALRVQANKLDRFARKLREALGGLGESLSPLKVNRRHVTNPAKGRKHVRAGLPRGAAPLHWPLSQQIIVRKGGTAGHSALISTAAQEGRLEKTTLYGSIATCPHRASWGRICAPSRTSDA